MQKKLLATLFFCIIWCGPVSLSGQILISGFVEDTLGSPIQNAEIAQPSSSFAAYTDYNGAFHLLLNTDLEAALTATHLKYKSQTILIDTTNTTPFIIKLSPLSNAPTQGNVPIQYRRGDITTFSASFLLETNFFNFEAFDPFIGDFNTTVLNGFDGILGGELGFSRNRKYLGFNYGLIFSENFEHDSLKIEVIKNHYGINFGYDLIDLPQIQLRPYAMLKLYRYRLLNYSQKDDLTLSQYLEERDLDIRFNQVTLGAGLFFAFHFKTKADRLSGLPSKHSSIGFYAAYLFKAHRRPIIYSRRNELDTQESIGIHPLNLGIFFSQSVDRPRGGRPFR